MRHVELRQKAVTLNLFQGPSRRTDEDLELLHDGAAGHSCKASERNEKWTLKQVQGDEI